MPRKPSPFHGVNWNDKDSVVAYAWKLGPGQVVYKLPGRRNYNITHVSRTDRYQETWVICKTGSKPPELSQEFQGGGREHTFGFGRLGFGKPTWARGISKPFGKVRPSPNLGCICENMPEVEFGRNKTTPIRNLNALHEMPRIEGKPHNPDDVIIPVEGSAKAVTHQELAEKVEIGNRFAELYAKLGKTRVKRIVKEY